MRLIAAILLTLAPCIAQPSLTAWATGIVFYNDQYGPPTFNSLGVNGCVGPSYNTAPCTGRWSNGDTFARAWDGTNRWVTFNDGRGSCTSSDTSVCTGGSATRAIGIGTMSADNLTWTTSDRFSLFGTSGSLNNGACNTKNGVTPFNSGSWYSNSILAYHTNLYLGLHCLDHNDSYRGYNLTMSKSTNGYSTWTSLNHTTAGTVVPASDSDMMWVGSTANVSDMQFLAYASCPDNYSCGYTRPNSGDTYEYMLCGVHRDYYVPCRILWSDLEANTFDTTRYTYLGWTGSNTSCKDGTVGGNWENDWVNLTTNGCRTTWAYSNTGDYFYSPDLNAFIYFDWEDDTGLTYHASSTQWGPWSTGRWGENPTYRQNFFAADLASYHVTGSGASAVIDFDVTGSGATGGGDGSDHASRYSISKRRMFFALAPTVQTPHIARARSNGYAPSSGAVSSGTARGVRFIYDLKERPALTPTVVNKAGTGTTANTGPSCSSTCESTTGGTGIDAPGMAWNTSFQKMYAPWNSSQSLAGFTLFVVWKHTGSAVTNEAITRMGGCASTTFYIQRNGSTADSWLVHWDSSDVMTLTKADGQYNVLALRRASGSTTMYAYDISSLATNGLQPIATATVSTTNVQSPNGNWPWGGTDCGTVPSLVGYLSYLQVTQTALTDLEIWNTLKYLQRDFASVLRGGLTLH